MSPKTTAVLTIVFAVVLSLNILGVFDLPTTKNTVLTPSPVQISKPIPTRTPLPKITLTPIRTPATTPLSLLKPTPSPNQTSQPAQTAEPQSLFDNFGSYPFEQILTVLDQPGKTPFGGKVRRVTECSFFFCDGAYEKISVGPPRGGTFMTGPNTTLYEFFDISEGNWILGLGGDDIICYQFRCVKEFCACFPNGKGPQIEIIGTSE